MISTSFAKLGECWETLFCIVEESDMNTSGRNKEDFLTLTEGLRKL